MTKQTEAKEISLQALLLLDSFDKCLAVLERPLGLINFGGHKFVDYALDCLSYTEVKEVFILTSADDDVVRSYVKKHRVMHDTSFEIHVITCSKCNSLGDLMRDVDKKGLIKSDFILMHCGTICNSNLKTAVQEHRARRQRDKNCVMTLVYTRCTADSLARTSGNNVVLAVQSVNKRLLFHKHIYDKETTAKIPLDIFLVNENVDVHFDLLDCNIAICSPQIPAQFSDNFDFETRSDLIREIITNDEILNYSAHVYILEDHMAALVRDYSSYLFLSMMLLQRYASPLLPDMLISAEHTSAYTWLKRNLYLRKEGLQLAKTAKLIKNVLIGPRCKIGENVVLEDCIFGSDCIIGDGSKLRNCILWDRVSVGSNCTINEAVLCDDVRLADACLIQQRSILLDKVSLNADSQIESGITLSSKDSVHSDDIFATSLPASLSPKPIFKLSAKFTIWPENNELCLSNQPLLVSDEFVNDDHEGDYADVAATDLFASKKAFQQSITPLMNAVDQISIDDNDRALLSDEDTDNENEECFYQLVLEILRRGSKEKIDYRNLILEINCAKPTYNVSIEKFNTVLVDTIITIMDLSVSDDSVDSIATILEYFLPILRNYLKSADSQLHCLLALQNYCCKQQSFIKQLPKVLLYLYENDVLDEDAILRWAKNDNAVYKLAGPFLKWLEEADEESSGNED